jgi:polyisoprenoid-binding protein YceI
MMRHGPAQSGDGLVSEVPGAKPRRRRHRWRWILGGLAALVVLAVAVTGLVITLTPGPVPLTLPRDAAAPSGPLDGTWRVAAGSVAGFRIRETVIGFSNDVTGRTSDVAGTMTVTGTQVSHATFQVSLAAISVNGKTRQPQLVKSLGVTAHPVAAITLARPLLLSPAFSAGTAITRTAAAALTLNGVTRPVTVTLSARRDGTAIAAAGSLPVAFSDFRVIGPGGYGLFGSLSSSGTAEFLLILKR